MEQKIITTHGFDEEDEELPNKQADISLANEGVVVSYQGEKVFEATNNKAYAITSANVDEYTGQFEDKVVDKWSNLVECKVLNFVSLKRESLL